MVVAVVAAACGQEEDVSHPPAPTVAGYCVDSVSGDDLAGANDCTCEVSENLSTLRKGTPCRTIARLLAVAPPAAANVFLARGSYWREQLYVAASAARTLPGGLLNGAKVLAYGSGRRPVLDGADVIPASSWTKTVGRTNVYQATVNTAGVIGRPGIGNRIWENWTSQTYWTPRTVYALGARVTYGPHQYEAITAGTSAAAPAPGPTGFGQDITDGTVHWKFIGGRLLYVADQATLDATPGSWTGPTRPSGGSDVIYVHPSDSSDPAASGKVYEVPMRMWGVNGGQYPGDIHKLAEIRGVETWRHGHHDGGILTVEYLADFRVDPGGAGTLDPSHGLWCNGTCEDGEVSSIVSYGDNLPPVTVRRVRVTCNSPLQGSSSNTGLISHSSSVVGGNKHAKKTYEDMTATACFVFLSGSAATHIAIIRPTALDGTVRTLGSFSYVDRLDVAGARWYTANTASLQGGVRLRDSAGALNVCGSRFVANRMITGLVTGDNGFTGTITARGNSFAYTDPGVFLGWRQGINVSVATAATITAERNLFFQSYEPIGAVQTDSSVAADYNVYSSHATQWRQAGIASTWAQWQALPRDANSVRETMTMAGDVTALNIAPVPASAAWTVGAGADGWGDANLAECIAAIP